MGRTIGNPVTRDVRSIGDALAVSLDAVGSLDLRDVASRIGLSQAETIEALDKQIYKTPEGQWQLADEYLSGDVVAKLDEAEHAVRVDPALRRNVEALKEVQPEKLGPSQISAKLGASWIPASHVNAYAQAIEAGAVTFDPTTETWQVDGGNLRSQRRAGAEYGTAMRSPSELLEAALNSRPVKIVGKDANQKSVTDVAATTAANEALKKIKDKFRGWVWTDTERASELVESYNKRFNNIAPRRFDGSHLTLPGVSLRYTLHPHQLRAIWRMIQTGNTYLAHAVGAGKTIEMIAAGMEQKRLGLIKKPIYVVPNHMLEQFSNEFMELYPLANIMVADDENFSAERRKAFIASATMNAPDAIIITHDAFQRVGVKEETVAPIRDALLADLEIELSETASGNDTRVRRSQLEQQIEAVTQRFDRIIGAGGKDSTIKFEDMGVDFVFADEAHVFRKLDFHTAQQIKGIDPNGSKRALDMYVKTRWLDQQRPGRSMAFASGTPVTNTMGELYTIMRFFAADELDRAGIATFDAWARQFGEVTPALEPNAAGKYELIERFAKFDNVPELMSRVRQFMDVLTSESLGALVKRPDLAGGKPRLNIVAPSAALDAYMKTQLGPRIQKSKDWKPTKEEPNNPDPIVAIITDGRFAAIDPRFFGGKLDQDGESIITTMGDKVVAGYHAGSGNVYFDKEGKPEPLKGSTQIVFYNLGFGEQSQRNRGFNSRAAFTKRLTDGGIPRAHIAWFDDANSDAKKEAIFKAMRSGKIRVLIGSAKKMGTGVNVQKRLAVLHYQDPPWFPADVEQPHGRIIRQGNQNNEVAIEWYTTKGTYQSTMWQMVARKQRFIDQAFTGDKSMRSMDDMGEASLFEQAAAVASGDPRAIQLAGLKQDVERYQRLQAAHASEQIAVRSALRGAEWEAESAARAVVTYGNAFKAIGERFFTFTTAKVGAAEFHKMGEFGQALKEAFNQTVANAITHPAAANARQVASLGDQLGITMEGTREPQHQELTGNFELLMNVGGLRMQIALAPGMGAEIDATGLARRVVNKINGIEPELQAARRRKNGSETDVVRLRKKLGAPFEYQQEMAEKYGDLKRLEEELRQEGLKKDDPAPATGRINADGSTGQQAVKAPAMPLRRADGSFARQAPLDGLLFSRAGESGDVLQQISQIGDAFRYRTSDKDTVAGITHDVDADVKVKKITSIPGETRYEFAFPDQTTARLMVRPFNQYGKSVYGFDLDIDGNMDNVVDERPGQFSDEAYGKGDVWIDVSLLNEGGGYGAKMYHIAANYAHNTNKVFIGDPAGMSHAALLRRPEQMLSSALKFGTTEHLAPHPKQIRGNAANGIAPLDWIYGDHLGNIHKLIDVNLKHIDNAGGNGGIGYDKHAGQFTAEDGSGLTRKDLLGLAKAGLARTAAAGGGTLARYALLSAGLQELRAGPGERRPGGILVFLRDQLRNHVSAVDQGSGKLKEIFYSRRVDGTPNPGVDAHDFHTDLPAAPTIEAGSGADAVPAPATLSGRDLLQARKDGQVLNRALAGAGMDPVRILRTAPNQQFAIARKIGEALGIKVNFIGGADGFDGVAYKGVAYLADGMTHPALAIAGHETLHALEQSNPALGERLRAQIRDYLKDGVVLDRQAREEVLSGFMDIPYAKAEGEVLADINGAMWMDPVFWRDLAKADRNLFRQVAYKFMQLATQAIESLRGSRFDVSKLVRDVSAVRAIMVATWAGHAQGLTGDDARAALDRQRTAGRQFAVAALQYGGRAAYASLRAVGATMLSYPQWVVTKTPNFQQFYGDWENSNATDRDTSGFYPGAQGGDDNRRDHGGADVAAPGNPTFPGQCGPVRAVGSPESATGGRAHARAAREPALYYHGSRADVDSFDLNHGDRKDNGWLGTGVYVTTDEDLAHSYASLKRGAAGPNIAPLFVAVRNPYVATPALKAQLRTASRAGIDLFTSKLVAAGHDGVALNFPDGSQELVAFNPAAVKSAIGNNGGFDAGSADIRFSRFGVGDALANAANSINAVRLPANYLVGDLFNDAGKLNWWQKTVGTMDNLAKRAPAFAKVYEAVQSFIGDVSRYAVVAADLAPTLLPKLENVRDIVGAARKKPLTAADTKAIGAPIFEGTLVWARDEHGDPIKVKELEERAEKLTIDQKAQILLEKRIIDDGQNKAWRNNPLDFYEATIKRRFNESQLKAGVVWSGAELRAMFGLTDTQIGQYREFRAATDKSLTNLSISEMVKLGGKDAKGMMERAVAAGNIHQAAELLRDHFIALAKAEPEKLTMHLDTAKQIMDLADKGADLMARGYAPLSRFGKYTVYVQEDDEQAYFGMFESQFEASKMARRMRTEYPGAAVAHGTVSQEAYKLFAGVSPETIELFGSMVGLDSQADAKSTEVYQTYLKLAKNNRSSMKRLIQRKGIAGFSEDAGRVLAGFIYSNARLTAGNAHLGDIDAAIIKIPKQEGELADAAVQLRDHIKNPESGGVKLGGLMFAQFLGGSVASAMVNLTQPLTMTLPYLSQFGGISKAGKRLVAAVRDAGKATTGEAGLDAAMKWATEEGIVAPQEVHYLQAQAAGTGALQSGDGTTVGDTRAALNNTLSKVMVGWGKLFAMAELTNRRVTFIAAYRTAVEEGMGDPARFAQESVSQTQGVYNSGNKPVWARGALGGLAMTFKQYSIAYLELLSRMAFAGEPGSPERAAGRRGALYMLAVLFLMSGADGLPFEQDLEDAIDGALQRMGYNFSSKRAKQAFLTDALGEGGADFALKGISSMPGMPVDIAGRFGMGNLIPGTGLFTKKESYASDIGELAGPAGDLAKRAFSGAGKALGGDIAGAALDLSPASVRNVVKGVDMLTTGAYKDGRDYKVNDVTPMEGIMKMVGFQPSSTADIQDAKGQALNMVSQNRMRSAEIQEHWAQGLASGDMDMVQEARAMRDNWNVKNPDTRITVSMPAVIKRVRAMHQDVLMRTQKMAPAALKAAVRGELSQTRQ
ncbi:N12 class adenine-specific DNA methylase [Oxalobacteraceae bacterium GrIS 1.11]